MKNILLALSILFLVVVGCNTKDGDTIKPNNTQGAGDGILYGRINPWGLITQFSNSTWNMKQAGIKVEILGTQISTETDGYGEFIMKGIDSGSYSLRFSKIGYETNQIDNVLCNGKDSIQIRTFAYFRK